MPQPRKIDKLPEELHARLTRALTNAGFGNIVAITEDLNFWLEEDGLEIRIGKSAVGEYSKLLKSQRDAFKMAETLLDDMDIERESDMHRVLMQMIATSAVHFMRSVSDDDGTIEPKDLMNLGRMLKDLMHSVGIREKVREDERARIAKEARTAAADTAATAARAAGVSDEAAEGIKAKILGVTQ